MSPKKKLLAVQYYGSSNDVVHCIGAISTYEKALTTVPNGKSRSLTRQMIMQIERLTRGERMSKQHFAPEGALPKNCGKKFYALKRLPIRGYCWLSSTHTSKYFISHYISKDFNKLRAEDISKVHTNWGRIEEQGDER